MAPEDEPRFAIPCGVCARCRLSAGGKGASSSGRRSLSVGLASLPRRPATGLRQRPSSPRSPAASAGRGPLGPRPGGGTPTSERVPSRRVDTSSPHFLSKLKVRTRSARRLYERCVKDFVTWGRKHGYWHVNALDPASEAVDKIMEKYLGYLFKLRKPLSVAKGTLFGWAWQHPSVVLKQLKHLPVATKAVSGLGFIRAWQHAPTVALCCGRVDRSDGGYRWGDPFCDANSTLLRLLSPSLRRPSSSTRNVVDSAKHGWWRATLDSS